MLGPLLWLLHAPAPCWSSCNPERLAQKTRAPGGLDRPALSDLCDFLVASQQRLGRVYVQQTYSYLRYCCALGEARAMRTVPSGPSRVASPPSKAPRQVVARARGSKTPEAPTVTVSRWSDLWATCSQGEGAPPSAGPRAAPLQGCDAALHPIGAAVPLRISQ